MSRLLAWLIGRTWWVRKWVVLLRERQLRVHAAADLIADELRANAGRLRRPQYRMEMGNVDLDLHFQAWEQQRANLYPISKRDPALWSDVRTVYRDLRARQLPEAEALEDLAERLETTRF